MVQKDPLQRRDQTFLESQFWNRRENQSDLQPSLKSMNTKGEMENNLSSDRTIVEPEVKIEVQEFMAQENTETEHEKVPIIQPIEEINLKSNPDQKGSMERGLKNNTENFNQWLESMNYQTVTNSNFPKREKIMVSRELRPKDMKKETIYNINPSASSETLAQLLVNQGYKSEAISMYEKLSLRFPEKKDIFADLIQKLKKN